MVIVNVLIVCFEIVELQFWMFFSNIEVEQVLLGVILVNNDVYYCVFDFFEVVYFIEDLYWCIYEVVISLIKVGKVVILIIMKIFLGDQDFGGIIVL